MQIVSASFPIPTAVKAKSYHWIKSPSNNQHSIPLTINVTRTQFQNSRPSLFLDYPTRLLVNLSCKSSYSLKASKATDYPRCHPCMAGMTSIFLSHLFLSYSANMQQHHSSFFRSSASRYGAWTSIGITVFSRYSC